MTQSAVIKTGGKQYIVFPGQKLKIEKLNIEEGKDVVFEEVLLYKEGESIKVGTPVLKDVKVKAKVIAQGKSKKVIVFKYKPKKRQKTKKGHRQPYTEIEIIKIEAN